MPASAHRWANVPLVFGILPNVFDISRNKSRFVRDMSYHLSHVTDCGVIRYNNRYISAFYINIGRTVKNSLICLFIRHTLSSWNGISSVPPVASAVGGNLFLYLATTKMHPCLRIKVGKMIYVLLVPALGRCHLHAIQGL